MFNFKIFCYRVNKKIKTILGKKITDDFDWKTYHLHYRGELEEISKSHTLVLKKGDYIFDKGILRKNNENILPLHPNHRLLYETILQLSPQSLLEIGCGGGDHLHNISILASAIKLFGLDLSAEQLSFLKERHPELNAEVKQFDITLPLPYCTPKVDIAYTQAVIMHIKTGNGHLVALFNMFNISTKQVILMENWKSHNFMEDINYLFVSKIIPWDKIFFYYRESEELKKPHLMIVSSVPLEQYPILNDYKLLSDNV